MILPFTLDLKTCLIAKDNVHQYLYVAHAYSAVTVKVTEHLFFFGEFLSYLLCIGKILCPAAVVAAGRVIESSAGGYTVERD